MKHLIYMVAAVSALGFSAGAFGCPAHTAAAGKTITLAQQQEEGTPAMQGAGSEDQGSGAATDESKPDSHEK